ncbi:hypothetical protein Rhopal_007393-T1 [Rhodotorula paludigena]|uniref:Threonine/serine exporter-like N-terminal domain-containing protein n=1 Tax=Rhodotorula paludigena TaxID=86838 RepID=A0AAV5GWI9_9BASI|nr:hypothetical protein Rhopal_007393-T1 [Rhodotorula paludigena]
MAPSDPPDQPAAHARDFAVSPAPPPASNVTPLLAAQPPSQVSTPGTPYSPVHLAPPTQEKPRRSVQFHEHVAEHVAVPFFSESVVTDGESTDDDHSLPAPAVFARRSSVAANDPFSDRYRLDDVPVSLIGGVQADGAADSSAAPVVQQLEVWVDPLERDGLPTAEGGAVPDAKHEAEGLVGAYTRNAKELWKNLSERRAHIRQMHDKEEDGEKEQDTAEKRPLPVDEEAGASLSGMPAGNIGILSALFALQQQEAALTGSLPGSASSSSAPTPISSGPPSPELSRSRSPASPTSAPPDDGDDSSSDEEERERFIARLRAKRASKNAFHKASHSVASASRHAASASRHAASAFEMPPPTSPPLASHARNRSTISLVHFEDESGSPVDPSAAGSAFSAKHRSHSARSLTRLISSVSTSSSPTSPQAPVGFAVPHKHKVGSEFTKRMRKLGDRLGLETETERTRPRAARSEAGVFGGLMLGATALAAPATPAGTVVAPLPTRPGYHLSRFTAPDLKVHRPRLAARPPSAASGMSLNEMVREEEAKEREERERDKPKSPPPPANGQQQQQKSQAMPPSAMRGGRTPAVKALHERRGKKKAVFSLDLDDMPSPRPQNFQSASSSDSRPSLTIDTSALNTSTTASTPSPTSATAYRFFGALSPRSAPGSSSSLHRDYFGAGGALSPTQTLAEREKERAERRAREEAEREAREREKDLREWAREKKRRRKVREKELKKRRIFITQHVAAILERQDFICKLARAFMLFGAPSHRLEAQIQATARVLDLPHCSAMYLPGIMLVNFGDPHTYTSDIKFLKQSAGLDIAKLKSTYWVYNKVIRDKVSVSDASKRLDDLMTSPPHYNLFWHVIMGAFASACVCPQGFGGSFIDCLMAAALGGNVVLVQVLLARNDLYMSLFEVAVCCLNAIIAGLLSYTDQFCFYSIAGASIVMILPGFIVLGAALELANRQVVSGAVRITYAALYSLFLGFGLSLGSEIYTMGGSHGLVGAGDYTCVYLREDAPWWRQSIPHWFYFLSVPGFVLSMALKNGQVLWRRDTVAMVSIAGGAWCVNFFTAKEFVNMPAITSFFGSFVVGILGNAWARLTRESAYVVMIVGTFVQLPSGLANGGLLRFATESASGEANSFGTAIDAAAGVIRVTVGTTLGLFLAAAVMNVVSRRGKKRGAHLSTF